MINKTEAHKAEQLDRPAGHGGDSSAAAAKKPFVEPEISSPVDVLEATSYFVTVASESTLPDEV